MIAPAWPMRLPGGAVCPAMNATIRDGIHIAEGSFIAMAAAVTKDTEPWGVYKGNPAQKGHKLSTDLDF